MTKKCKMVEIVDRQLGIPCWIRPDKIEAIDEPNHVLKFRDWSVAITEISMQIVFEYLNIGRRPNPMPRVGLVTEDNNEQS